MIEKASYYTISPDGVWRPMRTIDRHGHVVTPADARVDSPALVRTSYASRSPQLPTNEFNNVLSATPCSLDCGGLGVKLSANRDGLHVDGRIARIG